MKLLVINILLVIYYAASSESTTTASLSSCPYRTVNYITHSLPQQCLASSRIPGHGNGTSGGNETTTTAASSVTGEAVLPVPLTSFLPASNSTITSTDVPTPEQTIGQSTRTSIHHDAPGAAAEPETALEDDAELSGDNFLSFEDWKRQNLKKAGQSEHIGNRQQADSLERRKRPDHSLESLGEDGEIDIDFAGFVPGGPQTPVREAIPPIPSDHDASASPDDTAVRPRVNSRSKDAGTTCKERFNYASFDCAANVLKTNKEAKSPNTVLVENKDSYMLNQCSAKNKFIILELCADILVDTVVLANFEFFSSTFRTFSVSVSDRYPVKADKWKLLGQYEALNTRQVQAFLVEQPLIWARYLRIEFHTHYGSEFYCPLSLVRIHGTNMMDDYRHDLDQASGEDDEIEADQVSTGTSQSTEEPTIAVERADVQEEPANVEPDMKLVEPQKHTVDRDESDDLKQDKFASQEASSSAQHDLGSFPATDSLPPASVTAMEAIMSVVESTETCSPAESPASSETLSPTSITTAPHSIENGKDVSGPAVITNSIQAGTKTSTATKSEVSVTNSLHNLTAHSVTAEPCQKAPQPSTILSTNSSVESNKQSRTSSSTTPEALSANITTSRTKSTSATQAQHPAPSTQDSFFKSVQKRIQMLEANSSMSLQYIEDQSRALRDAFKKVEQRQLARTNTFLDQLNLTVLSELKEFRQQYDQLWQSTVIELEMQRERYEKDNEAINVRIGILADEVIFQRRLAILQMILILICLMLVLFSRGTINNYLELPIVQNMLARSPNSKWLNLSTDALIRTSPIRSRSAQNLRTERMASKAHLRMESEDSITDTMSGNEIYAPPTPVSDYGRSDTGLTDDLRSPVSGSDIDEGKFDSPDFDPSTIERPVSSPPTLTLNEDLLHTDSGVSEDEMEIAEPTPTINGSFSSHNSPLLEARPLSPTKRLSWNVPE